METVARQTIRSFTGLDAWKEGHKLVIMVYRITKKFPDAEQWRLTSQMRKAATSITSNIAEGFSRRSAKEKRQFYRTALASLTELQNQLLIARDAPYMTQEEFEGLANQSTRVGKLINGLIRSAPSKK